MAKNSNQRIEILDCTIRDGGYVNNWNFDIKLARETYRALSKSGVDYVELGYHSTEKYFDRDKFGRFRFSPVEDIEAICEGISGARISLMVDFGKFDTIDLLQYKNSPVTLIRFAFHKNKVKESLKIAQQIKKMGFRVSVNLMGFSSYSSAERKGIIKLLKGASLDYVYLSDTYGAMFPEQIAEIYAPLVKLKHIKWGFHPHNNLQMAFANTLAAIQAGVSIIDGSVYGMGRSAGNLPIETLLAYLHVSKPQKYNVVPVLNLIDRYYVGLKEKKNWGYSLPYMLSGIHACHPNFAENLVSRREYDIDDIWKILEFVNKVNPVGYSKEILDSILKNGVFSKNVKSNIPASYNTKITNRVPIINVPYLNRHKGKDFLVIANGPSINKYKNRIDEFISKYKPIVIGVNYLGGLFQPQYHLFNNKRRFVDYVDTISPDSKLMIGQHIPAEMIKEYTPRSYETIYYNDDSGAEFNIINGIITSNCRTVAILAIGAAIVMGAKRVFVAGLDGYIWPDGVLITEKQKKIHFYLEKNETEDQGVLVERHLGNLRYLEEIDEYMFAHGNEGIHIITPTSYQKFYKGIENYI